MLKTFHLGGVHPAENKFSAGKAIRKAALPKSVLIPITQHLGAPAQVLVNKGDHVKAGQKIAQAGGFVSAHVHSPVSGMVKKIDLLPDASGYPRQGIFIEVEGDEWEEGIDTGDELVNEFVADSTTIIGKIHEAGVVGMGGATFPTHVKLTPPQGMKADILIINGVECEPYLTSDHRLMLEKGREILVGIRILMHALQVQKAFIGIENNKEDAVGYFRMLTAGDPSVEVVALKVKYPQGGEKQLIQAITGREVPSGALPVSVGVVVNNVSTAFAVYEAVQKNKPLVERVVTVTGKLVKEPGNFLVRIGTPVRDLIEAAGGLPEDTGKIICGGPMMGKAIASLETPVTKGTSGLLLVSENESARKPAQTCIRCGRCLTVCPMGLEPYLLMTVAEKQRWEQAEEYHVTDCIECGSCSFTCPANRPLLDYIRLGKGTVGQIIRNRKKS